MKFVITERYFGAITELVEWVVEYPEVGAHAVYPTLES